MLPASHLDSDYHFLISSNEKHNFIGVSVSGKVNKNNIEHITTAVIKESEASQKTRILYDVLNAEPDISILGIFHLAHTAEKRGITRMHKRAVLYQKHDELLNHFETVSRKLGFNVKVFTSQEEAITWLSE